VLGVRNTYSASRERVRALMSESTLGVLMLAARRLTAAGDELRSEVFRLRSAGGRGKVCGK
jgi:hypothetical protein